MLLPLTTEVKTYVRDASVALAFDATKGDGWRGTVVAQSIKYAHMSGAAILRGLGSGRISRIKRSGLEGVTGLAGAAFVQTDGVVAATVAVMACATHLCYMKVPR